MVDSSSRQRTFDLLTSFYNNNLPRFESHPAASDQQRHQVVEEEQNETLSGIEENGQVRPLKPLRVFYTISGEEGR